METKVDELKTDTDNIQESKNTEVKMTQTKLDDLINDKFGKGANSANAKMLEMLGVESVEQAKEMIQAKKELDEAGKSELTKQADEINTLNDKISNLESRNKQLEGDMTTNGLAAQNGIKDVDYFKYLLANAKKDEKYSEDTFLDNLKTEKPYIFSGENPSPAKIDATHNKESFDISQRIESATTMAEINALRDEV